MSDVSGAAVGEEAPKSLKQECQTASSNVASIAASKAAAVVTTITAASALSGAQAVRIDAEATPYGEKSFAHPISSSHLSWP